MPDDSRYILAVDRGGTKCEAVLVREDGAIVGRGRCDFRHPESGRGRGGSGRTEENRIVALQQALKDWDGSGSLVVAADAPVPPDMLPSRRNDLVPFRRVGEPDIGMSFLEGEEGIAVQVGTGALLVGRARDGRLTLLDGLGPVLGDDGSAYHIGVMAMRAAARSNWATRRQTTLANIVPAILADTTGIPDRFHLVDYSLRQNDRSEIASLAQWVDREARGGDRVSIGILEEAAGALSETVLDLLNAVRPAELVIRASIPMIGVGGVIAGSSLYWSFLCERVRKLAPLLEPIRITAPPVLGFVLLAAREIGVGSYEAFREAVMGSAFAAPPDTPPKDL